MRIEYNFVSFGTEKQSGNKGYMALSENVNGFRYILPIEHEEKESNNLKGALKIRDKYDIKCICIARFLLISRLFLNRHMLNKKDKILIVGFGCVGVALYFNLLYSGFKKVTIMSKSKPIKDANYLEEDDSVLNYKVIFECSGNEEMVKFIIQKSNMFTKVVLMGTPRFVHDFDLLACHRKNLTIIGAHELNGISDNDRGKTLNKCLKIVSKIKHNLDELVEISSDELGERKKVYRVIKR